MNYEKYKREDCSVFSDISKCVKNQNTIKHQQKKNKAEKRVMYSYKYERQKKKKEKRTSFNLYKKDTFNHIWKIGIHHQYFL